MINTRLLDYLCQDNLLNHAAARQIAEAAQKQSMPAVSYLSRKNILPGNAILQYCARKFALPVYDLDPSMEAVKSALFSEEFVRKNRAVVIKCEKDFLSVGISDPTDWGLIDRIGFYAETHVMLFLIDDEKLDSYLQLHYPSDTLSRQLHSTLAHLPHQDETQTQADENDEPVSLFVSELLNDAKSKNISDIHIEPQEQHCLVRFRRDGLLATAATLPHHLAARVMTRLKIMANLNIAERRLPQDGRIKTIMDVRVNTCPALYGEKLVLRLLDSGGMQRDLPQLGLDDQQLALLYSALAKPQGMIIVTGPTGSGKTVTLYSALSYLNQTEKNIITIEDPIEISLPGINQININAEIGLTFASILHALLRQDPDIIMVGEIRDFETASIALQAAQTGHLVLTTLHTNSAAETLTRLRSMGMQDHYLTDAISIVIAQRLVRVLCEACKKPDAGRPGLYRAAGCGECLRGYRGRMGIFEVMTMMDNGEYTRLWEAGYAKALAGVTSYAELVRVLGVPSS